MYVMLELCDFLSYERIGRGVGLDEGIVTEGDGLGWSVRSL